MFQISFGIDPVFTAVGLAVLPVLAGTERSEG